MRTASFTLALLLLLVSPVSGQERLVSTDASVRTILNFKVSDATVQKLLPAGWELDVQRAGPTAGANLRITLIDAVWAQDGQGKPQRATGRNITLGVPVKKQGTDIGGTMLFGAMTTGAAPGVYDVFAKSNITSNRALRTGQDGTAIVEEAWEAKSDGGDAIQFQMHYVRGVPTSEKIDTRVYSGAKPDFYRIYRYTQASDIVRDATGAERVRAFAFKASGPKLSALFDGTEQLVSVVVLPFYSRQVFLPGS